MKRAMAGPRLAGRSVVRPTGRPAERAAVRCARPRDLDAVDAIERASFEADRFARRTLARLLKSPSAAVLIADSGGRPAGYAVLLFRKGAGAARLYSLAVAPEFRRRGVAARLLQAAESCAIERGAERLTLEVRASNPGAIGLYERAGFALWKRLPAYYDDGEAAVQMRKELAEVS